MKNIHSPSYFKNSKTNKLIFEYSLLVHYIRSFRRQWFRNWLIDWPQAWVRYIIVVWTSRVWIDNVRNCLTVQPTFHVFLSYHSQTCRFSVLIHPRGSLRRSIILYNYMHANQFLLRYRYTIVLFFAIGSIVVPYELLGQCCQQLLSDRVGIIRAG